MEIDGFLRFNSDIAGSRRISFSPENSSDRCNLSMSEEFFSIEKLCDSSKVPNYTDHPSSDLPIMLPSELLANKWRPRQYTQLLSDEVCNLKIMAYFESFTTEKSDSKGLLGPFILVLSGPPGVGKSSLCSVIARHWNFTPVEINASRERNESQFTQTVLNVLRSHSASTKFGDANAKHCLIVEELDGMSAAGVTSLLQTVIVEKRSCPVVCITNELYLPQLRNFRQHDLVCCLMIPPIDENRMLQRLIIIAKEENIYPSISPERLRAIVKTIVSQACGDIRVALNLLQFAYLPGEKKTKIRHHTEIEGKSPFAIWSFILSKKRQTIHCLEKHKAPVLELLDQLKRCSNVQLLADGIFENALDFHGIGTLHGTKANFFLSCAKMWSQIDTSSRHYGLTVDTLLRVGILLAYLSIQRDGAYVSTPNYRWPRVERDKARRDTQYGQMLIAFIQKYSQEFGSLLTLREVVSDYHPALVSCAKTIERSLNEFDYTRLSTMQQERVEHISVSLRLYGMIPQAVKMPQKKSEYRCLLSGYISSRFLEALVDIAEYCRIQKKDVYQSFPLKYRRQNEPKRKTSQESNTQMSIRSLMRDAPKLPVSKEAAEAERKRTDPFAKFRVPKSKANDDARTNSFVTVKIGNDMKRRCITPDIKVRFRPYKYSTSAVIRKALMSDFML